VAVRVRYVTDPACVWSWASEPELRRLEIEFDGELEWTFVMGGLARDASEHPGFVEPWLEAAAESGMPVDPLIWSESPLRSTHPACMAVKAAEEQGPEPARRYLRALREGIVCRRRKLDTTEPLVEVAREAGLDAERFRVDAGSHAIVEAFGADIERARDVPEECREEGRLLCSQSHERVPFPTIGFTGQDGETNWVAGYRPYEDWRAAAIDAGAAPRPLSLTPSDALARWGSIAAPEVAAVCDLPGPRAHAELWGLVADLRARPVRVGAGHLFEAA
jgi:predicted DsbA family dithiol-disulfide isomerase